MDPMCHYCDTFLKGRCRTQVEAESCAGYKEKERLKDEAETRAQQEISERLNLQPEVGQSTEDAIKDSLEDKAKSKLLELLGGD